MYSMKLKGMQKSYLNESSSSHHDPPPSLHTESLEPTYQQLQKMKLDKSPFVVVSVIGQELLTAAHHTASVVVLESALKIGTCSLKLRGSVFSALSSAHWSLGNTEKSTGYMQQDLEVSKTLGKRQECVFMCVCMSVVICVYVGASNYSISVPEFLCVRKPRLAGLSWPHTV